MLPGDETEHAIGTTEGEIKLSFILDQYNRRDLPQDVLNNIERDAVKLRRTLRATDAQLRRMKANAFGQQTRALQNRKSTPFIKACYTLAVIDRAWQMAVGPEHEGYVPTSTPRQPIPWRRYLAVLVLVIVGLALVWLKTRGFFGPANLIWHLDLSSITPIVPIIGGLLMAL